MLDMQKEKKSKLHQGVSDKIFQIALNVMTTADIEEISSDTEYIAFNLEKTKEEE